jgi:hypothetical protein
MPTVARAWQAPVGAGRGWTLVSGSATGRDPVAPRSIEWDFACGKLRRNSAGLAMSRPLFMGSSLASKRCRLHGVSGTRSRAPSANRILVRSWQIEVAVKELLASLK